MSLNYNKMQKQKSGRERKVDAADRMIAALEEAAHLVVVVEQVWNTVANTYELFEIQECCFLQRNACSRECCQIQ